MANTYLIGIDGGTEGLRAAIFDTRGTMVAHAAASYRTYFPHPGWAEQNPKDWWSALVNAVRQVIFESGVKRQHIAGLCVDATSCSVVALDERGGSLRPAMIWMDVRSDQQAQRIASSGDPALCVNSAGHGPVSAEWFLPKALWLKENEAEIYARTDILCEYVDYINYRLTGQLVASLNNASIRWHYDITRGGFPKSLLAAIELDDLLEKLPQQVIPMGQVIGGLSKQAASELGLPPGLPVVQGGADAFVAMIGLGVVRPGKLAFITGSSHLLLGLSDSPFYAKGLWGTYPNAVVPNLHVIEGGQTSTGSIVAWLRNIVRESESDYSILNSKAAALPPGAEGLLVLDHFQGNRTPYTDPNSRGVITGLTLKHGPEHLFRAIIEGIAFGSELILEVMRSASFVPTEIVISGGATRSDLWLQIHSDVSNLPLTITRIPDAPLLGSAILAAVGSDIYPDIPTATDAMVHVERVISPNSQQHNRYRELFALYKQLYPNLATLLHHQASYARSMASIVQVADDKFNNVTKGKGGV